MTRKVLAGVALAAMLAVPPTALATSDEPWELGPQGWRSGPVIEHVANLPLDDAGAIGAVRHGKHLFVSGAESFSIYDITRPAEPVLVSSRDLGPHALNEHPDTNGKILLLSRDLVPQGRPTLEVWDVSDKADPARLGAFENPRIDHTWACVLDCSYAYGSSGTIVSLADPAAPVAVGDWRTSVTPAPTRFHGIDEVAPGLVLTASQPTVLLDARRNPATPTAAAVTDAPIGGGGVPSYAHWPGEASDRFALETIETPFSGPCTEDSGGLVTYDTLGYEETGRFEIADEFRLTRNGTYTDGAPPANVVGCSAFGLAESEDWEEDGLVAMAAMEHGVRLLQVDADGRISEIGGFMGHGTVAAYPVWGSRRILYVADVGRGLDVFRVAQPGA